MSLHVAVAQIEAYDPPDAQQARVKQRMLEFCDAHPDALDRSCRDGHLTGSGFVVDPSRDATLLLLHAKLGLWLQPGGHADGNGDLAAVALDEATEETGIHGLAIGPLIDVDVHTIPFTHDGTPGTHLHLDCRFLVLAPPGSEPNPNHESRGHRWFALGELTTPDLRRMGERGFALCR